MNDLVSVVVPIYMVEKYLSKCIDSLLKQDYTNLEIVLVDDGSCDKCPAIADEYASRFFNIEVYHKKNGGLGDARNYGVRKAKGEWIAFVDSDDYVSETYISDLVRLVDKYSAEMAITCVKRRDSDNVRLAERFTEDFCCTGVDTVIKMYGIGLIGWQGVGKLFKRQLLEKFPFPNGYYEDCSIMYQIVLNCKKIAVGSYINNYLYITRSGSILQQPLNKEHFRIFDICDEYYSYIKETRPELLFTAMILYQRSIHQMLVCQKMNWSMYQSIFKEHRGILREYQFDIYRNNIVTIKTKVAYFIQCTTPEIHWFAWHMLNKSWSQFITM